MAIKKMRCPLCEIMNVISKKWALLIINAIGNTNSIRFGNLKRVLIGINSKVLSDRLKDIEAVGLIHRKSYDEIPPHVEYFLTDSGKSFRKAMIPLMEWFYSNHKQNSQTPCDIAYQIEKWD
ncbi:MAG: winged helix-turn-helix transcriptional regulator [Candidatus Thorarchaeota archaeon]